MLTHERYWKLKARLNRAIFVMPALEKIRIKERWFYWADRQWVHNCKK
jgi:hypothetical protein